MNALIPTGIGALSAHSCARTIFQPRYDWQRRQDVSRIVYAPLCISWTEGADMEMLCLGRGGVNQGKVRGGGG